MKRAHHLFSLFFLLWAGSASLFSCETADCVRDGCGEGQVCNRDTRLCEAQAPQNCLQTGCGENQRCDTESGLCRDITTTCLLADEVCPEGNECSTCPEGLICDATEGICTSPGACDFLQCPQAQRCNPETRNCEVVPCDPNDDAEDQCPTRSICANEGICLPGCRNQSNCREGEECTLSEEGEIGSCSTLCTDNEGCPWGQICVQDAGRSSCDPEPPCETSETCRTGEECRSGTCKRALCSSDDHCDEDEYCEIDTGSCLDDACISDMFEPNNSPPLAYQLRRGSYRGLTLCRGEEDWFSVQTRGVTPLSISMLHAPNADLDLEAYFDGEKIASSRNSLLIERVVVPASYAGEVKIRVFSQKGSNATYQLELTFNSAECVEDTHEPNNSQSTATEVSPGQELNVMTCSGDQDWFSFQGRSGPLRLEASPAADASAHSHWPLEFFSDLSAPQEVPRDASGDRVLSLAYVSTNYTTTLLSQSTENLAWTFNLSTNGPRCEDPLSSNHTADTAATLEPGFDEPILSRTQLICTEGSLGSGLEEDWFLLDIPDGNAGLNIQLNDLTRNQLLPSPPLRATLFVGEDATPWRSVTTSAQTPAVPLQAQVSRLDRPVWLRVDAPGGLPEVLESWPTYQYQINATEVHTCVQDRSEAGGNNNFESATALSESLFGILCPSDVDVLRVDNVSNLTRLNLSAFEAAMSVKLTRDPSEPPFAVQNIPSGPQGIDLRALEEWPEDAEQVWISIFSNAPPASGILYRFVRE